MKTSKNGRPGLNVLYLEIGRGHPFYLDGVVKLLETDYSEQVAFSVHDAHSLSRGVSRLLWAEVEYFYRAGSQGGVAAVFYEKARKGRSPDKYGFPERILARHIRKWVQENPHPTLVSHPLLVPMISDQVSVFYQHGEIAAPRVSAVTGAEVIFVPLEETKAQLSEMGIPDARLFVSGLCIEPFLAAGAANMYEKRLARLQGKAPLVGGFFSSGAEPPGHVRKLVLAAKSMAAAGQKAVVFCRKEGRLQRAMEREVAVVRHSPQDSPEDSERKIAEHNIMVAAYENRSEEDAWTLRLFGYLDYFVAPPHERTNWAVGLGLPMFILHPLIGPFAPLNREFLLERKVALDISDEHEAENLAGIIQRLRNDGFLVQMAQNGFGNYNIDGFRKIALYLADFLNSGRG